MDIMIRYEACEMQYIGCFLSAQLDHRLFTSLFCLWKTYLNVSTIATSFVLSKKLIKC